jgi:hypothetical protein
VRYAPSMSPASSVELARLLLADAGRAAIEARLAAEPAAPSVEAVCSLGERARRAGASEEQTALALGLLHTLGAGATPESTAP